LRELRDIHNISKCDPCKLEAEMPVIMHGSDV
jgi:hypothetical protein